MNNQRKKFKEFSGEFKFSLKLDQIQTGSAYEWKSLKERMAQFRGQNFKSADYV